MPVQHHRCHGRQMNRNAFSSSLKHEDELVSWTVAGRRTRLFQTHGSAMKNNRSPVAVCILGTSSTAVLAQCMPAQCWPVYCRSLIWCAYHIPKVLVEQLQEEDQNDNWLTQFHLKMIARQMCACVCTNLHKMNKIFLTKNNAKNTWSSFKKWSKWSEYCACTFPLLSVHSVCRARCQTVC